MKLNKTEQQLLDELRNRESVQVLALEWWGTSKGSQGKRMEKAARALVSKGLARVIEEYPKHTWTDRGTQGRCSHYMEWGCRLEAVEVQS